MQLVLSLFRQREVEGVAVVVDHVLAEKGLSADAVQYVDRNLEQPLTARIDREGVMLLQPRVDRAAGRVVPLRAIELGKGPLGKGLVVLVVRRAGVPRRKFVSQCHGCASKSSAFPYGT
jgi:hypothetical protein